MYYNSTKMTVKVRVKKTGEIKIVADYARVSVEDCNSYGDPLEYSLDEIEIVQGEDKKADNKKMDTGKEWEEIRIKAAIAAMQGILSNQNFVKSDDYGNKKRYSASECSEYAIRYANALVEDLKKNQK